MKMKILCLSMFLSCGPAALGASTVHLFIPKSVLAKPLAPPDTVSAFDMESALEDSGEFWVDRFDVNRQQGDHPSISSTIDSAPVPIGSSFTYSPFSSPGSYLEQAFETGVKGRSFSGNKLFMDSEDDSLLGSSALRIFRLSKLPWSSSIEASKDLANRRFAEQVEKDFRAEAVSGIIYLDH